MALADRDKAFEERYEKIIDSLRKNENPSKVATLLSSHYLAVSRECMEGLTPTPEIRDHWFKFYMGYQALKTKFEKIENK